MIKQPYPSVAMNLKSLAAISQRYASSAKMPALFIGHGNPMNALLDNSFTRKWKEVGSNLPRPQAILVISAHWLTRHSTLVTAMQNPRTIHDFGGFPKALFEQDYAAPGSPEMASFTKQIVKSTSVEFDHEWGLDHGAWSVLLPMFPNADIPVYQMSIDFYSSPLHHYELGKELNALRHKGVLIVASGNIVHNLRALQPGVTFEWAQEFDHKIATHINDRDFKSILAFDRYNDLLHLAHPTVDHFLPLLYLLGLIESADEVQQFNTSFDMGSISMRSVLVG